MTERLSSEWPCNDCKRTAFCGACERPGIWMEKSRKKLAEYETAEEEGRLVVLPCKVGDIIFCIVRPGIIRQFKVLSIEIYEYGAILELLYAGNVEKYALLPGREEAIEAIKVVQQYREIGTVEECREAVEKQKPKKVIDRDLDFGYYTCPSCGTTISFMEDGYKSHKFCLNCGQAILQEDEDD